MPQPLLTGRVALITGAASGLGKVTSELFAEEGASVLLCDIDDEAGERVSASINATGGTSHYKHVQVRSAADLDAAVSDAECLFGHLDTVVANAGVLGQASYRPSEELSDEYWNEVLDINLSGSFRTLRAAIPALRRSGGGSMAVTSSVTGVFAVLRRIAYSASKGGVNALVRSLAVELSPDRIRVNAVAPGGMRTNIHQSLGRDPATINFERPAAQSKARMLWEERDSTLDVAKVHLFVASHLANYVSGETIVVDGGASIWNGT